MSNIYRKDGWVKSTLGPAIAGAQIYVCSQPANSSSLPPSPLVSLFSDPGGLVPITQPIITDGFGHYDYYVAPGLYTEIVAYGGTVQQVYPDQSIGNVGTAGTSSIVFQTNGTDNFDQFLQNLVQGSGIVLVTDNLGNTTITSSNPTPVTLPVFQTNEVANSSQALLDLASGTDIGLAESAGKVTITNTRAKASTMTFSVPLWTNASGSWRESPGLGAGTWGITTASQGASVFSIVQPTSTVPGYILGTQTGAANISNAEFIGGTKSQFLGMTKTFQVQAAVFATTNLRYWIGLTSLTTVNGSQMESLTPTAAIAGFRYVNGTDTNWTAYVSTDNTHSSTHDTGVALDTTGALHTFEIRTVQGTPGTVNFYIDGVSVGSLSTNVPAATTALTPLAYCESLFTTTTTKIGCNLFYSENFQ